MELLEYQAKALFQEVGLPVLPSQQIHQPRDLKQLRIPYPIVLKSQVRARGRARSGGIRFAENTIDAIAAAQTILKLPINGECPDLLLAETRYQSERELYLAVILDYQQQLPVLLGSTHGGVDLETALSALQTVPVEGEFSPFYARRLAIQMGLTGDRIVTVSRIVEKMYRLFDRKDLDTVEINPLGLTATGKVMALDGKVTLSAAAVTRHPELKLILDIAPPQRRATTTWHHPHGKLGILSTDAGLAMMLWDTLTAARCGVRSSLVLSTEDDLVPHLQKTLRAWCRDRQYHHIVVALPPEQWRELAVQTLFSEEELEKVIVYCPGLSGLGVAVAARSQPYPIAESLTVLIQHIKAETTKH